MFQHADSVLETSELYSVLRGKCFKNCLPRIWSRLHNLELQAMLSSTIYMLRERFLSKPVHAMTLLSPSVPPKILRPLTAHLPIPLSQLPFRFPAPLPPLSPSSSPVPAPPFSPQTASSPPAPPMNAICRWCVPSTHLCMHV